jgi:hypothetical protein
MDSKRGNFAGGKSRDTNQRCASRSGRLFICSKFSLFIFKRLFIQDRVSHYVIMKNGKRFVVRADEKLSAFMELESAIRAAGL